MEINDFQIRTYGWQELAILYAPELTPESASKRLSRWLNVNQPLQKAFVEAGWNKGQRILPPLLVRILVEHLGEP